MLRSSSKTSMISQMIPMNNNTLLKGEIAQQGNYLCHALYSKTRFLETQIKSWGSVQAKTVRLKIQI